MNGLVPGERTKQRLIVVNQGRPELDSSAAKLTNDRMNRLAGFLLTSIAGAFLLVARERCLAQTQLVPVKVAVPALFRSSPFDRGPVFAGTTRFSNPSGQPNSSRPLSGIDPRRRTPRISALARQDLVDLPQNSRRKPTGTRHGGIAASARDGFYRDRRQNLRLHQ
jgi:hypothetical protein